MRDAKSLVFFVVLVLSGLLVFQPNVQGKGQGKGQSKKVTVPVYTKAEVDALVAGLQSQIDALNALLAGVSRTYNDITFSGVNVHIVDGSGSTDGAVNGLGNLIVGYNEVRGADDDRSSSHNIVVGRDHNYSSYGGVVVGYRNTISGPYASVSGGRENTANGEYASVSVGRNNTVIGDYAYVGGGGGEQWSDGNEAFADYS
nr:hypothetical protein [uncultured bacterium]